MGPVAGPSEWADSAGARPSRIEPFTLHTGCGRHTGADHPQESRASEARATGRECISDWEQRPRDLEDLEGQWKAGCGFRQGIGSTGRIETRYDSGVACNIPLTHCPCRYGCNLKLTLVIFKLISRIDILSLSCEIALRWMPQDLTDD